MDKKYIIMPYGVSDVGGAELYVLHKLNWLEANGWEVHIITASCKEGIYKIAPLDRFRKENLPILNYAPFQCPRFVIDNTIERMKSIVGTVSNQCEVIVESHTGALALWGELLSEAIKAKHVIALINETFDEISYKEMLPYFEYKLGRQELFGGWHAIHLLFDGYENIDDNNLRGFELNESPVQDIEDERLEKIQKSDYTICYIGRADKRYVPSVFEGVSQFAKKHNDKHIQFVVVGDANCRTELIKKIMLPVNNLSMVLLGDVFPIPKKLYQKIDVVIAGSGSARASAQENVYTIVADPDDYKSNGLLGYDTTSSLECINNSVHKSFQDTLEDVLILELYQGKKCFLPEEMSPTRCCEQNMKLIKESNSNVEYYGYNKICWRGYTKSQLVKSLIATYCPFVFRKIINHRNLKALKY